MNQAMQTASMRPRWGLSTFTYFVLFGILSQIHYTDRFVLLVVEGHAGHRVEAHPHGGGQHQGDAEERQVPDVLVFDFLL